MGKMKNSQGHTEVVAVRTGKQERKIALWKWRMESVEQVKPEHNKEMQDETLINSCKCNSSE